jgi:hypothetical protein
MYFMNLNMFSNFMQVLNIKRKCSIKNDHFPKYIIFTIIYLSQKQNLNHNKYYEQKINIFYFVQARHDVHMYAKFGDLTFYRFL